MNWRGWPTPMLGGVAGVIAMDASLACMTERVTGRDVIPFAEAVMFVLPIATPTAPEVLTLATDGDEDVHMANAERFCVLPSE